MIWQVVDARTPGKYVSMPYPDEEGATRAINDLLDETEFPSIVIGKILGDIISIYVVSEYTIRETVISRHNETLTKPASPTLGLSSPDGG